MFILIITDFFVLSSKRIRYNKIFNLTLPSLIIFFSKYNFSDVMASTHESIKKKEKKLVNSLKFIYVS